ncbi:hypothetical protein DB346_02550 [Verrucomicrobia bacterium LW23]|nr:hypothetical protein DB346_04105 [Verrucomicrobia bacterium LW23]PTY04328.1 hypothetical protein DB346_02550 [Verrucomicrobia bacterium LW23]
MHDRMSTLPRKKLARQPRDRHDPITPPSHKSRKPSRLWQTIRHLIILAAWGTGIITGIVGAMALIVIDRYDRIAAEYNISALDDLPVTTMMYDRSGEEIGRIFTEDRTILTHDQIPQKMRDAVVAVEDERFYYHQGIDYIGLVRALVRNLASGQLRQGGSTISQQLAKHLMNNFSRTLDRKLTEFFVALRIEQKLSKDKILDYYLNRIYFGKGHFGLASAARGYFNKSASDLTIGEMAMLAGIIRSPNSTSPRRAPEKARDRRNVALAKMRELGYITPEEEQTARSTNIRIYPEKPPGVRSYYASLALKELLQILPSTGGDDETSIPAGLNIVTTIDMRMQRAAQQVLEEQAKKIEDDIAKLREAVDFKANPLQGACIVADSKTGAVRVLIGGRSFMESQFDRATQARRENGALIYPLLFLKAFQSLNFSPASMINATYFNPDDVLSAQEAALGNPQRDIGTRFMTLYDATVSGNQHVAIRLALHMGLNPFFDWLRNSGVVAGNLDTPKRIDLSNLTLWEICNLYQVFNHDGATKKLHLISSVTNQKGEVIYQEDPTAAEKSWASPSDTQAMQQTLLSASGEGQGRRLKKDFNIPAPVAGMPAYSTGYRDAYYVGYTPSMISAVWMGFDSSRAIGNKKIARASAIPLWAGIMEKVMMIEPKGGTFAPPSAKDLVKVNLNRKKGTIEGVVGFVPKQDCIGVWMRSNALTSPQNFQDTGTSNFTMMASLQTPSMEDDDETADVDTDEEGPSVPKAAAVIPRIAKYRLPAMRGNIITNDGELLATMRQTYNIVLPWPGPDIAPSESTAIAWARAKINKAANWTRKPITIPDDELQSLFTFKRFQPLTIAEDISPEQIDAFPNSPLVGEGFFLQGIPRRVYPQSTMASHVLGYLRKSQGVSRGEYKAGEVMYEDFNGGAGLEQVYNNDLKGTDGHVTIATTPEGYVDRVIVDSAALPGKTLRTTLNHKFQAAAELHIDKIRSGAIVVVDVHSGAIVVSASKPNFNPNDWIPSLPEEVWTALTAPSSPGSGKKNPLRNNVIAHRNPPGSVFKTFTVLAAASIGKFDPRRVVNCPGYFDVGTTHYNLPKEVGNYAFKEAFRWSINTYFLDMGVNRAGRDAMLEMAHTWGFGQKTGIDLPGEVPGMFPTPEFVRARHQRNMGGGDIANASIGQGDVLATPLQMANAMAALANGGVLYKPRMAASLEDANGRPFHVFQPEIIRQIPMPPPDIQAAIKEAMQTVAQSGTASLVGNTVPHLKVACKTGTAQVGSKKKPRQIAWLGGYFPADNPQYAFSVMVEGDFDQDLHGGSDAGGLAAKVFSTMFPAPQGSRKRAPKKKVVEELDPAGADIPVAPPVRPAPRPRTVRETE